MNAHKNIIWIYIFYDMVRSVFGHFLFLLQNTHRIGILSVKFLHFQVHSRCANRPRILGVDRPAGKTRFNEKTRKSPIKKFEKTQPSNHGIVFKWCVLTKPGGVPPNLVVNL